MENLKKVSVETSIAVSSEKELNDAIFVANKSNEKTMIEIVADIVLTAATTAIVKDAGFISSGNYTISGSGFNALFVSSGANVFVAIPILGTVSIDDQKGMGTRVTGLTGGSISRVFAGGVLDVPVNNTFSVNSLEGSSNVCGVLNNAEPMVLEGPWVSTGNALGEGCTGGQIGDVTLSNEAMMILAPGSDFKIGSASVYEISSIGTQGSPRATVTTTDGIKAIGIVGDIQIPGSVLGVNIVGEITLIDGGIYASDAGVGNGPNAGGSATTITNTSGSFNMGEKGIWEVDTYTQTAGELSIRIPNFKGDHPLLKVKDATITGGKIVIKADQFFAPSSFTEETITLVTASSTLAITDLSDIVEYTGFDEETHLVPTLAQVGNELQLTIKRFKG